MIAPKKKRKLPVNENPRCLAYARVSTDPQAESGLGLASQDLKTLAYYNDELRPRGVLDYSTFVDEAVSAFKQRFCRREAGGELDRQAQAGDHIVIPNMDRGFRDTRDYLNQIYDWAQRGVYVHVLDTGLDTSNERGLAEALLLSQIRATIAEYESRIKAQRMRDINTIRRQQGRVLGSVPVGWRKAGPVGAMQLVPNEPERQTMALIVRLRETGMGFAAISTKLCQEKIMWKKPSKRERLGYTLEYWSPDRCHRGYNNLLKIWAEENTSKP